MRSHLERSTGRTFFILLCRLIFSEDPFDFKADNSLDELAGTGKMEPQLCAIIIIIVINVIIKHCKKLPRALANW